MKHAVAALLLLAACSPEPPSVALPGAEAPPAEVTGDGVVRGEVVSVDGDPMMVDGDGIVTLRTDDGATVSVFVAARVNLCPAEGLALFGELAPGDRVEAYGQQLEGGVRPCDSETHYLRRL